MLRRLWGPGAGPRETTAATALLLVLVIGAAHATRGDSWPARDLMRCDVAIVSAQAAVAAPVERTFDVPARTSRPAAPARHRRVLTIADAELPPVRAPDRL